MNSKRAISELEQIYGFLSPDKQMALDVAIGSIQAMSDYKKAFEVACELLNDHWLFGWDRDKIFEKMMEEDGVVSSNSWERWILAHLSELSGTDAENDE